MIDKKIYDTFYDAVSFAARIIQHIVSPNDSTVLWIPKIPKGKRFVKARKVLKLLGIEITVRKTYEYECYIVEVRRSGSVKRTKEERLGWLINWLWRNNMGELAKVLEILRDVLQKRPRILRHDDILMLKKFVDLWMLVEAGVLSINVNHCVFYEDEEAECVYRGYLYPNLSPNRS